MVINKTKNTEVLSLLYPLTDTLNSRANNEKTKTELSKVKAIFSRQLHNSVIRLECSGAETGMFLYDLVKMLSAKNHLAVCAIAGRGITLEALNRLKRRSKLTEYYFAIPTDNKDDRLTIFIGSYLPVFGEKYDIDLAVRLFLNKQEDV